MKFLLPVLMALNLDAAPTVLQEMDTCLNQARSSVEVSHCLKTAYQSAEQTQKSLYQSVLELQTVAQKKRFVTAQSTWLKFRDSYCNQFMAASLTGVDKSIVQYRCLAILTFERNEHFTELLNSP